MNGCTRETVLSRHWIRAAGARRRLSGSMEFRTGPITAMFFENGNMLARVSDTAVPEEEAQNNLEMFEQEYLFYDAEAQ